MIIRSKLNIYGVVEVIRRDARTGRIIRRRRSNNLITTVGKNLVRDASAGNSMDLTHMALGDDNTSAQASDTALGNELYRDVFTSEDNSQSAKSVYRLTLGAADGNGNTYREAGLFDAATAGNLFARLTFADEAKTSDISLQFNWTVNWG